MSTTILVVDDEKQIVKVVKGYLEQAGFRALVAYDGQTALNVFRNEKPALVVLDLNLPGLDGLEVGRVIRAQGATPIIMLTARAEEADKLRGLELGADDYIVKPFSPREVVARVRAVLRRAEGKVAPPRVMRAGDLELDLEAHRLTRGEKEIALTPTEFDLLAALMQNPDRAYTREQLIEAAPGDAFDGFDRTIDAHIKNLRKKIELDSKNPRLLVTVFGVGYKFVEE